MIDELIFSSLEQLSNSMNFFVFAAASGETASPAPGFMDMVPLILGVIFIFYFIVIVPQNKVMRRKKELMDSLKKNDKVLTEAGIIGVIYKLTDKEATLKIDDKGARIQILRTSIVGRYGKDAEAENVDKGTKEEPVNKK